MKKKLVWRILGGILLGALTVALAATAALRMGVSPAEESAPPRGGGHACTHALSDPRAHHLHAVFRRGLHPGLQPVQQRFREQNEGG